MIKLLFIVFLSFSIVLPTSALEIEAPPVPQNSQDVMPAETESFGSALWELVYRILLKIRPEFRDAIHVCICVFGAVLILSLISALSSNHQILLQTAGTTAISVILLQNTNSMFQLGTQTIQQLSDYGKLLFPVMTSALAAQGGSATSAALYTGTAVFDAILGSLISSILLPLVFLFLAVATASSATGAEILKRIKDTIKVFSSWCLKIVLTIFTTYMSITGVVSGHTDAAMLKAAKVTISSAVPVVGGILSDASEAILVSAGFMKTAAGVYGILALLAVFLEPFLKIGMQYLMLKGTALLCGILATGRIANLIDDFSTAMGLILAMTGSVCLLLLISTFCYMKGVE